jgi:hypothetical protein
MIISKTIRPTPIIGRKKRWWANLVPRRRNIDIIKCVKQSNRVINHWIKAVFFLLFLFVFILEIKISNRYELKHRKGINIPCFLFIEHQHHIQKKNEKGSLYIIGIGHWKLIFQNIWRSKNSSLTSVDNLFNIETQTIITRNMTHYLGLSDELQTWS